MYLPAMVKEETMWHSGQLPKFRDNLYHDAEEDFWFVPTAEVPLTNLHGDEILEPGALPLHYIAYTPCFRREKMSAGRDVRGIKRGHQFDKVEMYKFCAPETVRRRAGVDARGCARRLPRARAFATACVEPLHRRPRLQRGAHVRHRGVGAGRRGVAGGVVRQQLHGLPGAAREHPLPPRGRARKPEHPHTLNGSGLALPRTMIAIMENYQQADGSIEVPEVLRDYMNGAQRIEPS